MSHKQRNGMGRLERVLGFCGEVAGRFGNTPPRPGDAKFTQKKIELETLLENLRERHVRQTDNAHASGQQEQARQELLELMREVHYTVAAIAEETRQSALIERFRIPYGGSDAVLVARAQAFAEAIGDLELTPAFEAHGFEIDVREALDDAADDLMVTEATQDQTLNHQVGATTTMAELMRRARSVVKTLDVIFRQRFRGDRELLAHWDAASHVERVALTSAPKSAAAG